MTVSDIIYLDNNATSRVDPRVVAAMAPYWSDVFFNPASEAGEVFGAQKAIFRAKKELASCFGGTPDEFVLTSGATEANNWVLKSVSSDFSRQHGNCALVVSAIEHASVRETATALAANNECITFDEISVTSEGVIDLASLEKLVTPKTGLVSVMLANNETGVIQPIAEAAKIVKELNPSCLFHTDATQAVGRIGIDLDKDFNAVDILSLSAHKSHGPKGVGALFVRQGIDLSPLIHGGGQQGGRRAGTENPALAMGLAATLELMGYSRQIADTSAKVRGLRDLFETCLQTTVPGVRILGRSSQRLPNTSLVLLPAFNGSDAVSSLLGAGIIASTGSACDRGSDAPSHVLLAMGVGYGEAFNAIRLSLSLETTENDIAALVSALEKVLLSNEPFST